eukprot:211018-Rhodomonas_salina.2
MLVPCLHKCPRTALRTPVLFTGYGSIIKASTVSVLLNVSTTLPTLELLTGYGSTRRTTTAAGGGVEGWCRVGGSRSYTVAMRRRLLMQAMLLPGGTVKSNPGVLLAYALPMRCPVLTGA